MSDFSAENRHIQTYWDLGKGVYRARCDYCNFARTHPNRAYLDSMMRAHKCYGEEPAVDDWGLPLHA